MKTEVTEYLKEVFKELEAAFPTDGNNKHFFRMASDGTLHVWISHNKGRFVAHDPFEVVQDPEDHDMKPKEFVNAIKRAFDKRYAEKKPPAEKKEESPTNNGQGVSTKKKKKK